jgi:hypothetical protein
MLYFLEKLKKEQDWKKGGKGEREGVDGLQ